MMATHPIPVHALSSGLCEDGSGEAAALIVRMARGDGRSLAELHAMWAPALSGIANRMLGDRQEAGKIVKDTFVRIWRGAADYDPQQMPPFVWAFSLMRDLCIERLRRRSRRRSSESTPPALVEIAEDFRVMPASDWRRVRAALDALPPEERNRLENAVFLGFARPRGGKSHASPSTADKSCLRRALDTVRKLLSRYEL
jgi:RNA polymerase sigma-70 factor (ECF subfamily)